MSSVEGAPEARELPAVRSLPLPMCKVCGAECKEVFRLPSSKLTGHPIPEVPDDCPYFECLRCQFLFCTLIDEVDNAKIYNDDYWKGQDPDWGGRVTQTLRLVWLANRLLKKNPWELKILDFGCGMGTFVHSARELLQLSAWGTDIIQPKFGREYFLSSLPPKFFDVVVACEVVEHLPQPEATMRSIKDSLNPGGVFAFQTAYYDPKACGRDWWYLGPGNGHVSLYSPKALEELFRRLGGKRRLLWNRYAGLQAWRF